ncbi:hypothetical protein YTPLAS18_37510 [Nitrospira sp.]|nr:hypothetical protein YTPLAS18_37510 [Nitrospira sp.]
MTPEELRVGQFVQVSADRWGVPVGTLARIRTIGRVANRWCFTVEWLTRTSPIRRLFSLNLFVEDLAGFETYAGPVSSSPLLSRSRRESVTKQARPPQLLLPFVDDHPPVTA